MKTFVSLLLASAVALHAADPKPKAAKAGKGDDKPSPIGYSDTPVIPGTQWKVHDIDRPRPAAVAPGKNAGDPPADAIIIFDGKSSDTLQAKEKDEKGKETGKIIPCPWELKTASCSSRAAIAGRSRNSRAASSTSNG